MQRLNMTTNSEPFAHVCLSQGKLKVRFLFNMTKSRAEGRSCRRGEVGYGPEKTKGGKFLVKYTDTGLILVQKRP